MVVPRGGAVSYERGAPAQGYLAHQEDSVGPRRHMVQGLLGHTVHHAVNAYRSMPVSLGPLVGWSYAYQHSTARSETHR